MNTNYTDVDRMIISRWDEVIALRDAYDELLDRMRDSLEGVCDRVKVWLEEREFECDIDVKTPQIDAWKASWEKPRGKPLVYFRVGDFAPLGYGKVEADHPWLWVVTKELERIKLKDPSDRAKFARDLKEVIGPAAASWDHEDADPASEPLGRYRKELTEQQRVELTTHPARLVEFIQSAFTELFELEPAIDATLSKYRGTP
jgi:hypothetical protein